MWRGQVAGHLPERVTRLELPRHWAQRVQELLAATYAAAGRLARARLTELASADMRLGTVATMDVLPARALMLIGVSLVFRDGVAMILGMTAAAFALVMTAGRMSMA